MTVVANDRALFRIWGAADEQAQKQRQGDGGEGGGDAKRGDGGQKLKAKGDELKEEMDNLIDQIDDVLEENAEEFVKNYVQRGGQ